MKRISCGFTLIELMIVIAIIGVLSTMAIPTYQDYIIRSQVDEASRMADGVKLAITEYYDKYNKFPSDNRVAGVPEPGHLIGNYVTSMRVSDGALHITLGNRVNALARGKVLSWRPAYVEANRQSPISWLCGYAEPVTGMSASAVNETTLPAAYLSPECRSWKLAASEGAEATRD